MASLHFCGCQPLIPRVSICCRNIEKGTTLSPNFAWLGHPGPLTTKHPDSASKSDRTSRFEGPNIFESTDGNGGGKSEGHLCGAPLSQYLSRSCARDVGAAVQGREERACSLSKAGISPAFPESLRLHSCLPSDRETRVGAVDHPASIP